MIEADLLLKAEAKKEERAKKTKKPVTRRSASTAATGARVQGGTSAYNPTFSLDLRPAPRSAYQVSALAEALEGDHIENAFAVVEAERAANSTGTSRSRGLTTTVTPLTTATLPRNATDTLADELASKSTAQKYHSIQLQVSIHSHITGAEITRQVMLPAERCPSPTEFMKLLGEVHQLHMEVDGVNRMKLMRAEMFLFSTGIDSSVAFARLKKGQGPESVGKAWNRYMVALERKGKVATKANECRAERAQRRNKGTIDGDKEVQPRFVGIIGAVRLFYGQTSQAA